MKKVPDSEEEFLDRAAAAKYVGATVGTMSVWASTGRHNIPFEIREGRAAFYKKSDLDAFRATRRRGGAK